MVNTDDLIQGVRGGSHGLKETKQDHAAELTGEVRRITYRSDDGYTVFTLERHGKAVTCVGHFPRITPGDQIKLKGDWVLHPKYGRQFNVTSSEIVPPRTTEGLVRYLSSGLIPGIGRSIAERIVKRFGERTLEVIEKQPNRLTRVEGLGRKRVAAIKKAWKEHKDISELVVFFESHGVRTGSALKIYKHYGAKSIEVVRENPYRLASEIWGIGFATADRIASRLGIEPDAPVRVRAGIAYALYQASDEGHVYLPEEFLRTRCVSLLGIDEPSFEAALQDLVRDKTIVCDGDKVYLPVLSEAEGSIAAAFKGLLDEEAPGLPGSADKVLANIQIEQGMEFDSSQLGAIKKGLGSRVLVITGGPGTGKTTIVRALVKVYESEELKVGLAAPTGRAAKRMSELAGRPAKTIHRLLEYNPQDGLFRRNAENPLDADVIIIDEASMLDILLASALLRALKPATAIIFVGDVDQLPPVGPGSFLRDIMDSRRIPVARLTRIFRQEEGGAIVENAHRINAGEFPVLSKRAGDFYLLEKANPAEVAGEIVDLCARRLPSRFGLDRFDEIQVLSPMYKGDAGATNLNHLLQHALNPEGRRMDDLKFKIGDKVMQLRNNYEKMVFNGDIGRVVYCDPSEGSITVRFDFEVDYERTELDEITLAYAITVHKSQGSEFPCVVMPVLTQHYIMLYRNLLYTAVTRAKRLVVLVGTKKALALAVRNIRSDQRFSSLADRLSDLIP
jgi:exodeoxyribonuclease V alpha subunit